MRVGRFSAEEDGAFSWDYAECEVAFLAGELGRHVAEGEGEGRAVPRVQVCLAC